ncbi:hypothetical protein J0H58_28915 [bacterium]|nr:hypothetical protein [bacterium]
MIHLGNDLVFTLADLTDAATGAAVTDAAVSAELRTDAGEPIAGTTVTLAPVTGGDYRGVLSAADLAGAGVVAGQDVIRRYTATSAGRTGRWDVPDTVALRTG